MSYTDISARGMGPLARMKGTAMMNQIDETYLKFNELHLVDVDVDEERDCQVFHFTVEGGDSQVEFAEYLLEAYQYARVTDSRCVISVMAETSYAYKYDIDPRGVARCLEAFYANRPERYTEPANGWQLIDVPHSVETVWAVFNG